MGGGSESRRAHRVARLGASARRPEHDAPPARERTSGYSLPEDPGRAWAYNDYAWKLFILSLLERVEGVDADDRRQVEALLEAPDRLGALLFEDDPIVDIVSVIPRFYGSPRDFARIAWFWLERGQWNGRLLLPPELVTDMLRFQVPASLPRTAGSPQDDYLGEASAPSGGGADG